MYFPTPDIKGVQNKLTQDTQVLYYETASPQQGSFSQPPNFFSLLLFKHDKAKDANGMNDAKVDHFQIQLLFPDQSYQWKLEGNTHIYQILISQKVFNKFGNYLRHPISFYLKNTIFNLSEDLFQKLAHEFRSIRDELMMEYSMWDIVYTRLRIIAIMINREIYSRLEHKNGYISVPILARFIILVVNHYREQQSTKFYAEKLFMSANYLNILCKKHLGKTATSIIKDELIFEIKHRLVSSNDTIKELAIDLNFSELSGLSAFFKRQTGMSPKAFQQQYRCQY